MCVGAGLKQYGWLQHDGESFGVQQLHDEHYNITIGWVSEPQIVNIFLL